MEANVPRWNLSFKVSALKEEIGSILLDHEMGLMGKKGIYSSMIPFEIEIYNNKLLKDKSPHSNKKENRKENRKIKNTLEKKIFV